ncbi:hypothetical protein [Arthrospiribacter ruber]|uniref:DUF4197 domain-containing protein n=1 Tax=Arthrospiribacter ruber TaxID=2487934 RepID=A0A951IYM6_9BACT|nr:hypothetical protein [Arthrospiribacter ruber]MBW3468271.1 hypothetical protein [Arthrospiribacter ruber]
MKKSLLLFTLIFAVLSSFEVMAQRLNLPAGGNADLPTQVLNILNKTDGLGLNADQESKLKSNNKSFTDDVFKVLNSSLGEDAKKSQFLDLKKTRQNFLLSLLGKQLLGNYNKGVGNMLKPLQKQLGPAALAFL